MLNRRDVITTFVYTAIDGIILPADKNRRAIYWTEGDSYMAGASGAGLSRELEIFSGAFIRDTSAGDSSIKSIYERIQSNRDLIRGCDRLIIWDGFPNNSKTRDYIDLISSLIEYFGPVLLFLPPVRISRAPFWHERCTEVQNFFSQNYISNYMDAQAILAAVGDPVKDELDIMRGVVPGGLMQVDGIHLQRHAINAVARSIMLRPHSG